MTETPAYDQMNFMLLVRAKLNTAKEIAEIKKRFRLGSMPSSGDIVRLDQLAAINARLASLITKKRLEEN